MTSAASARTLRPLQRAFKDGKLEIVVGAGASQDAGLPSWDELAHRVLAQFIRDNHPEHGLSATDLLQVADVYIQRFGRNEAIDVVRSRTRSKVFDSYLHDALYAAGPHDLRSIHYELAAMLRTQRANPRLFTFNYDNLLERAGTQFIGKPVKPVTRGDLASHGSGPIVVHLHGYLPPRGEGPTSKPLILSERDYLADENGWATRRLLDLGDNTDKTLLFVGLSLTDPRLRRVLYTRTEAVRSGRRRKFADIWVLLLQPTLPAAPDRNEIIGHAVVSKDEPSYWKLWSLNVVPVWGRELIPHYLRQIRLGDPAEWTKAALDVLRNSGTYRDLYSRDTQRKILKFLAGAYQLLVGAFHVPEAEVLHLGAFVPTDDGKSLQMGFRLRNKEARHNDELTAEFASTTRLRIPSPGAAGMAYLLGATFEEDPETPSMGPSVDEQFPSEQASEGTFASLLWVPVYDSPQWAPIGVVYLNSNMREPFWKDLSHEKYRELEAALRSIFRSVFQYRTVLDDGGPGLARKDHIAYPAPLR